MKVLKYILCSLINHGTEEEPKIEEVLSPVTMGYNETNEEIAKAEAYNGEYEIYDDGIEEVIEEVIEPTQLDIIEAQVTYTAMMTDTLLEE